MCIFNINLFLLIFFYKTFAFSIIYSIISIVKYQMFKKKQHIYRKK